MTIRLSLVGIVSIGIAALTLWATSFGFMWAGYRSLDNKIDDKVNGLRVELETKIDRLDTKLSGEIDDLRTEFNGRFDEVNRRFDEVNRRLDSLFLLLADSARAEPAE